MNKDFIKKYNFGIFHLDINNPEKAKFVAAALNCEIIKLIKNKDFCLDFSYQTNKGIYILPMTVENKINLCSLFEIIRLWNDEV